MYGGSAGAPDRPLRSEFQRFVALGAALASCGGCSEEPSPPDRLVDGSPPVLVGVRLEDAPEPVLGTRVRIVDLVGNGAGSPGRACRAEHRGVDPGGSRARAGVLRVGVDGESITFRDGERLGLYACDRSTGPGEPGLRWCGHAYARLAAGRLRDPRLGLGCADRSGRKIAFVWIEPGTGTAFVSVLRPGFTETYRVSRRLPLRVATAHGVDVEGSRASFDVLEHDRRGSLVRRYRIDARVAG